MKLGIQISCDCSSSDKSSGGGSYNLSIKSIVIIVSSRTYIHLPNLTLFLYTSSQGSYRFNNISIQMRGSQCLTVDLGIN